MRRYKLKKSQLRDLLKNSKSYQTRQFAGSGISDERNKASSWLRYYKWGVKMENPKEIIPKLKNRSIYLVAFKSEYMVIAQDLLHIISNPEEYTTSEYEMEIYDHKCRLLNLEKSLLDGIDMFANTIKLLNNKLEGGERDED